MEAFKEYKAYAEKHTGAKIKKLRTDNGTEYLSWEFTNFLKEEGITRQLTVEYTPQQNGVAERSNRTLVEMARCMLTQTGTPLTLWAEAINAAAYTRNRCPTKANQEVTPHEIWTEKKPYIGFMRSFGSRVIALEKGKSRNKFAVKGKEYVLVGYSNDAKAYRLWEKGTRTVIKRRDVRFLENWTAAPMENEVKFFEAPMQFNSTESEKSRQEQDITGQETQQEINHDDIETIVETPLTSRGPGRPKLERTGKPGRPRKIYSTRNTDEEPRNIKEATTGQNREK